MMRLLMKTRRTHKKVADLSICVRGGTAENAVLMRTHFSFHSMYSYGKPAFFRKIAKNSFSGVELNSLSQNAQKGVVVCS